MTFRANSWRSLSPSSSVVLLVGALSFLVGSASCSSYSYDSCPATCYSYDCDYWSSYTCAVLEGTYGCDCSGCACANDRPLPPPSPSSPPYSPLAPEVNPLESSRSYSSVWGDDAVGTGHARSMLDSDQAWSAGSFSVGEEWMSIPGGAENRKS